MAVYQEKDKGTWRVVFRYTDFTGERKQTQKRGFKTKREVVLCQEKVQIKHAFFKVGLPCQSFCFFV